MADQIELEFLKALRDGKGKVESYTTTLKGDVVLILDEWSRKGNFKDKKEVLEFLTQLGNKAAINLESKSATVKAGG